MSAVGPSGCFPPFSETILRAYRLMVRLLLLLLLLILLLFLLFIYLLILLLLLWYKVFGGIFLWSAHTKLAFRSIPYVITILVEDIPGNARDRVIPHFQVQIKSKF